MSSRAHIMVRLDERSGGRSLRTLLDDLVAQPTSSILGGRSPCETEATVLERSSPQSTPRRGDGPVLPEDQRLTMLLRLGSAKQVAVDAYDERAGGEDEPREVRFAFSLNDTMDDIHACWTGEAYALDRVLSAMDQWESDTREVFRFVCGARRQGGQPLARHAYMGLDAGWMSPEACSMVYHADARELLVDIARCHLSLEHGVPMLKTLHLGLGDVHPSHHAQEAGREDEDYLSFVGIGSTGPARAFRDLVTVDGLSRLEGLDAAAARAVFELLAEEHDRVVRRSRLARLKKTANLEGLGLSRILGREASIEVSTATDDGIAVMTNPCSTLLNVYQKAYEIA